MAVVITSTTSSQAELDHATSENWRSSAALDEFKAKAAEAEVPVKEQEIEKPEPEQPEGQEADQNTEHDIEESGPKPKPEAKKKGGVDKRIDNLTKARREAEIQRDTEKARAERLEQELAVLRGEAPRQVPDREPTWKEFQDQGKSIEEFLAHRDAWRDVQAMRQEKVNKYNETMEAAKGKYKDWSEAAKEADATGIILPPDVGKATQEALLQEDNAADVVYYLWKHPDETRAMITMSPQQADRYIAKLAGRLSMTNAAPAKVEKPKVQPPPPIEPVTNATSRGNLPLDSKDVSLSEYIRIRNKQERERKRG